VAVIGAWWSSTAECKFFILGVSQRAYYIVFAYIGQRIYRPGFSFINVDTVGLIDYSMKNRSHSTFEDTLSPLRNI
jgi:hypothetical protein